MKTTLESARPRLRCTSVGTPRKPRWQAQIWLGEDLLHADTLDLNDSRRRRQFVEAVTARLDERDTPLVAAEIEKTLLQQLEKLPASDEAPDDSDLPGMLETLGIEVLGERDDQSIVCRVTSTRRLFQVADAHLWTRESIIQAVGQIGIDAVADTPGEAAAPGQMPLSRLREALALAAHEAGRLDDSQLCGQGVWELDDKLLIVNGLDAAIYDGNELTPVQSARIGSKLIDIRTADPWLPGLQAELETMTAARAWKAFDQAVALFGKWHWQHPQDARVAAGLAAATFCQSLWRWRPLVGVHGPTAAGKTTLMKSFLERLFGPATKRIERPTEAGLRQLLGSDCTPVLIDEFDEYRHRDAILELARTAGGGGSIVRGTRSQEAREFRLKHLLWFASIESGTKRAQDRNRFLQLQLMRPEPGRALELPTGEQIAKLGVRLAAASIRALPRAEELADQLKLTVVEGVDARLMENYAVAAAMIAVLEQGPDVDLEAAREVLLELVSGRENTVVQSESEEVRLLQAILASRVTLRNREVLRSYSVGQLLAMRRPLTASVVELAALRSMPSDDEDELSRPGDRLTDHEEELQAYGVRLVDRNDGRMMLFLYPDAAKRYLLKDTEWAELRIDEILVRLPGAGRSQQRIAGQRLRGLEIPWEVVQASVASRTSPVARPEQTHVA